MPINRVFIADDHQLLIDGLKCIIDATHDFDFCGSASSGNQTLNSSELQMTDLILLDLNMPDGDGLSIVPDLKNYYPNLKILIVTHYKEQRILSGAYKTGIDGHFWKDGSGESLLNAMREVVEGNIYMPDGFSIFPKKNGMKLELPIKDSYSDLKKLTPREIQILHLFSQAKPVKQIANELFISSDTVTVHKKNIMKKLEVKNLAGMIKFAYEQNVKDLV